MPSDSARRLIDDLVQLTSELLPEIEALSTEREIRAAETRTIGRGGKLSGLMKQVGKLPPEDREEVGQTASAVKEGIANAVATRLAALAEAALAADLRRVVDVTLPGRGRRLGTLHPLTLVRREIEQIFLGLGFEVKTGPWIETEWNNFDALNTPPDHPARDMQDTLFVEGGRILRWHTSPIQIRTMLAGPPPVRMVASGNVFRRDHDATHTPMFPQMEGLLVDKAVSFADLKGTLLHFVQRFFGPRLGVRLRPSYFPFTEPSAEVDAACHLCEGSGHVANGRPCRLCKGTGWIEIGGSGMVHPNVFKAVGYDPKAVSGFAFGVGLSRMAMLKYGVDDLRSFYDSDARFLAQFR
jgi:phenylalanyl-tRNA synthetase alpha chain